MCSELGSEVVVKLVTLFVLYKFLARGEVFSQEADNCEK